MRRPYNGRTPALTTKHIRDYLPSVLKRIGKLYRERPDLVVEAWPAIIGPKLAGMTKVLSFVDGVLTVGVKNSTLHSLLSQNDRPRIIRSLRDKFPGTVIKTVVFRLE